jgi:hypothetical protein
MNNKFESQITKLWTNFRGENCGLDEDGKRRLWSSFLENSKLVENRRRRAKLPDLLGEAWNNNDNNHYQQVSANGRDPTGKRTRRCWSIVV